MEIIADLLLAAGALGAGFYCFVLGRRLNKFNDLETGVGGAVAVLSAQVDDLTKTLDTARISATRSAAELTALAERAENASRRLEMQIASLHDIPSEGELPPSSENATPQSPPSPPPTTEPMFVRRRAASGVN